MSFEMVKPDKDIFENPVGKEKHQVYLIDQVIRPAEGGVEVWYQDHPYPRKLAIKPDIVREVAILKRYLRETIKTALRKPILMWLAVLYVLHPIFKKIVMQWLEAFGRYASEILSQHYLKDEYWCKSGRELKRAIEKCYGEHPLGYFVLMVWEFDEPYRFMGQKVVGQVRQSLLEDNPRKEIARLIKLAMQTRKSEDYRLKNIEFVIRFAPEWMLEPIANVLQEIDIQKIEMDEADKYWAGKYHNYNFV